LLARGIDVLTAQWDNATRISDADLLDRATTLGRVLVTQDDDLLAEAALRQRTGREFAGVIYAHQQAVSIGRFIHDLEIVAQAMAAPKMVNCVEFLPLYNQMKPVADRKRIFLRLILSSNASLWTFALAYPVLLVLMPYSERSAIFEDVLARWVLPLLAASWIISDAQRKQKSLCYDFGTFVFFAWPLVGPIYLFQTRGIKALAPLGCVLGMYLFGLVEYWILLKIVEP
jgi:hypothetical protein